MPTEDSLSPQEFNAKLDAIEAKLAPDEWDLIQTCVMGAEVNNSILYVILGVAVGVLGGVLGTLLVVS